MGTISYNKNMLTLQRRTATKVAAQWAL